MYVRGFRRAFKKACDLLRSGKIRLKKGKLHSPARIEIPVTITLRGEDPQKVVFKFKAKELGFK